jgi:hypothetical protein
MTRLIRVIRAILSLSLPVTMAALALTGCTPHIGDGCTLSTDCSVQGTLVCDTSQPGGYCTELNCVRLSCPSNSTCVMFQASVPGCAYNDYQSPSRTGRSFCMENCTQDSDCRAGYECSDPRTSPWNGAIIDDNQSQGVCIAPPPLGVPDAGAQFDAAICQPYDADAAAGDDGGPEAGADAALDGAVEGSADAGVDATVDAGEGGAGSSGEGGIDAGSDAPFDAGSTDAPGGG